MATKSYAQGAVDNERHPVKYVPVMCMCTPFMNILGGSGDKTRAKNTINMYRYRRFCDNIMCTAGLNIHMFG